MDKPNELVFSRASQSSRRLLRRAGHRAERAEHAAVAFLRAQPRAAPGTVVKELAGVDRHRFASCEAAARTGDYGIENDVFHALQL